MVCTTGAVRGCSCDFLTDICSRGASMGHRGKEVFIVNRSLLDLARNSLRATGLLQILRIGVGGGLETWMGRRLAMGP